MKRKHFLDLSKEEKEELITRVIQELEKQRGIRKEFILDILVTGSRTYVLGNKKDFYREKSDLDIVVIINEGIFNEKFDLEPPDTKRKTNKSPWLETFYFHEVRTNIFVIPAGRIDLTKYRYWKLPVISLYTNQIFNYNESHLLDYLQNVKKRIESEKFCFLCLQETDAPIIIDLKITSLSIPEIIEKDLLPKYRVYLCESCFKNALENGFKSFLKQVEQIKK